MSEQRDPRIVTRTAHNGELTVLNQTTVGRGCTVLASYVCPAGWGYDPQDGGGTANLVTRLVTRAAGALTSNQLPRRLDRIGASFVTECDSDHTTVTILGPAEYWRELLVMLGLVVQAPRFDLDDVIRAKRELLEEQRVERYSPSWRAGAEFLRSAFPAGHPYRASGRGSHSSVSRTSREALDQFHQSHYLGEGGSVVVTAPNRSSAVNSEVRRIFAKLQARRYTRPSRPDRPTSRCAESKVDISGACECEVLFGGVSIAHSDPLYPEIFLANQVLGGRQFLSRLYRRLREEKGLAYDPSSQLEALRLCGYWIARAGTAASNANEVLELIRSEINELRTVEVTPPELGRIVSSVIGGLSVDFGTSAGAHSHAIDVAKYGLDEAFMRDWPSRLRSIRPSDLIASMTSALDPAEEVTVVVGPLGRESL